MNYAAVALLLVAPASGFRVAAPRPHAARAHVQMNAKAATAAAAALAALSTSQPAEAARSGGRVGGRVGGGMRGGYGGGGGMRGGGATYIAPMPMMSPFGFSPFGFGMPFSPFGFGFGFGVPAPLLLLAVGGLALTSFRSSRGIEAADNAGAALCLQVACYCDNRRRAPASRPCLARAHTAAPLSSCRGAASRLSAKGDPCRSVLALTRARARADAASRSTAGWEASRARRTRARTRACRAWSPTRASPCCAPPRTGWRAGPSRRRRG